MAKIDSITELKETNFIKPIEIQLSHDSVAILLYHKDKDAFVLVKQLRVTVLKKTQKTVICMNFVPVL